MNPRFESVRISTQTIVSTTNLIIRKIGENETCSSNSRFVLHSLHISWSWGMWWLVYILIEKKCELPNIKVKAMKELATNIASSDYSIILNIEKYNNDEVSDKVNILGNSKYTSYMLSEPRIHNYFMVLSLKILQSRI